MGVAHHAAYAVWFEMGRTELLRAGGLSYRELEASGALLAVVSLEVKYRKPAKYDDVLSLHTTLESVGYAKIEHSYQLRREGDVLATARTVLACVDENGRPRPVPDVLRA